MPNSEEDQKKFEAYKKRLVAKYKAQFKKPGMFKHPQNLSGGRSRRSIKKFVAQNKKPQRN